MIFVAILCGGAGTRFGPGNLPKQFEEVGSRPLFVRAIETYVNLGEPTRIFLIFNPEYVRKAEELVAKQGWKESVDIVEGGATRQASVANALAAIEATQPSRDDVVVLHNGVSPNTPTELISRCLKAIGPSEAVQAYYPAVHTIFEVETETLGSLMDRERLGYTCDPTVYRLDLLRRVVEAQRSQSHRGERTLDTAKQLGVTIHLVESDPSNIKVTNPWDLAAVKEAMGDS